MKLERHADYYFWNIVFVMYLLVVTSFTTVFLDPLDFADRQGISFTIILAAVAYKYVVASLLPRISYLTLLDKYVVLAFLLLNLNITHNVLVYLLKSRVDEVRKGTKEYYYYYDYVVVFVSYRCVFSR